MCWRGWRGIGGGRGRGRGRKRSRGRRGGGVDGRRSWRVGVDGWSFEHPFRPEEIRRDLAAPRGPVTLHGYFEYLVGYGGGWVVVRTPLPPSSPTGAFVTSLLH